MDIGLHPQPGHIAVRDTSDIPAIANSAITVMSVGGLDTVMCWSMFNKQFSRGKEALICSSCQFPWCKYSHYDQFQATNMTSQNRELGKDAQWHTITQYFPHTVTIDVISSRV